MGEIPVSALRGHLREVLAKVEAGERIRITRRGRLIAELVPAGEAVPRWKRPPGVTVTLPPGHSVAAAVLADRAAAER